MLVIVPNSLSDAINAVIDQKLKGRPCDANSREIIYGQVLAYFDEHGHIPEFELTDKEPTT